MPRWVRCDLAIAPSLMPVSANSAIIARLRRSTGAIHPVLRLRIANFTEDGSRGDTLSKFYPNGWIGTRPSTIACQLVSVS